MSSYTKIASTSSLYSGFAQVKKSNGTAGYDKQRIEDFEANIEKNIYCLSNELKYFHYKPKPVVFFEVPKKNGEKRLLSIFSVRDRVVQSSFMLCFQYLFEREYEKESYGYRKGFSREALARKISYYYNEGYKWVLDVDIEDYFNSVDHSILINKVENLVKDRDAVYLLLKWN